VRNAQQQQRPYLGEEKKNCRKKKYGIALGGEKIGPPASLKTELNQKKGLEALGVSLTKKTP